MAEQRDNRVHDRRPLYHRMGRRSVRGGMGAPRVAQAQARYSGPTVAD